MKEIARPKPTDLEQSRLKDISEGIGANSENFSAAQADQKLTERLDIGADIFAGENLDKKTIALKKEINELLAERYNTSPTFEELRSKSKIGRLSKIEEAQYAILSRQYPDRAKISATEQRRTNIAYEDAKRYKVDFQVVDTLRFYSAEYENAKMGGTALKPQESDLYDKLHAAYAEKLGEHMDEVLDRARLTLR